MAVGLKIIDGDVVVNNRGTLDVSSGNDKCLRDFGKMLQTQKENDKNFTEYYRYNPEYGTNLGQKELFNGISRHAAVTTINLLIEEAIQDYLSIQESRSNLSPEEIITNVDYHTYFDPDNKSQIICSIKITNGHGEEIDAGIFTEQVF